MIDGLKLDVSVDELVRLLEQRIAEHTNNAAADEAKAEQIDKSNRDDDDDEMWCDDTSASARLRRRAQRERDRADTLTFLSAHLVRGETYRLAFEDLRTLEIVPGRLI